jgi:ribonuclease HI
VILKVGVVIEYQIFTDGAYSSLRNQGGVGIVFIKNGEKVFEYSRPIINTTNNRCELYAVTKALQAISNVIDKVTIYSDSQYVIGTITKGWKRNKNKDLWESFDKYYKKLNEIVKIFLLNGLKVIVKNIQNLLNGMILQTV